MYKHTSHHSHQQHQQQQQRKPPVINLSSDEDSD
jgi:hypothetical protein